MVKLVIVTLIFLLFGCAHAQKSDTIKNLVFEGAGIRGLAYSGAIFELEAQNKLIHVEKVGGTSAGAITALAFSLCYTGKEIYEIISNTKFKKFNDGQYMFFGGFRRLRKNYGWYKHGKVRKWLENIVKDKAGSKDITFNQLSEKGFKELHVVGTLLEQQKKVVFNKDNYPDMKVVDAVIISMSIPIYFEAIHIDANGYMIKWNDNTTNKTIACDGGMIANFPIDLFDVKTSDSRIPNNNTLGFRIDVEEQLMEDAKTRRLANQEITSFKDYISAFYTLTLETINRQELTEQDWQRTASISCGNIGPKIKKMSLEEKQFLFDEGRKAVVKYLK